MSILVDLDGTLAHYDGWHGPDHIGEPIPLMQERVMKWLSENKTVIIFTARASVPDQIPIIKEWLKKNGFGDLHVTNQKGFDAVSIYDDRAVTVETNTGRILTK